MIRISHDHNLNDRHRQGPVTVILALFAVNDLCNSNPISSGSRAARAPGRPSDSNYTKALHCDLKGWQRKLESTAEFRA